MEAGEKKKGLSENSKNIDKLLRKNAEKHLKKKTDKKEKDE